MLKKKKVIKCLWHRWSHAQLPQEQTEIYSDVGASLLSYVSHHPKFL